MLMAKLQQSDKQVKQTCLDTWPSAIVGSRMTVIQSAWRVYSTMVFRKQGWDFSTSIALKRNQAGPIDWSQWVFATSTVTAYVVFLWELVMGKDFITMEISSWWQISLKTYMLFAGREVRIGKNCARGLEYGPRPQTEGRPQDQGHSFSQYGPT